MPKLKYKFTSPLLMWLIILIGGIIIWRAVPAGRLFYNGWLGWLVLALGVINWLVTLYKANQVHKRAPSSVEAIDKIITEGVYEFVRHPIYMADIILFWSVLIFFADFRMLALTFWATIVFIFWAALEERMLEEKFLEDYREYKQRVPMLIPKFKK